jgi:hypothetical protein
MNGGDAARPKPSRRAVALVLAADLAIGASVGFAVYFATRKFGPPTPPRNLAASASLCLPDECRNVTPSVALRWAPPVAGGEVIRYVVRRDGDEVAELGPAERTFTDEDIGIGERYGYDVFAIGSEGRSRPAGVTDVAVPVPPIEHAHFGGAYEVELVFRRIGLLSRYEGVMNPAVGDRTVQGWDLLSVCAPLQGACDVALFGYELTQMGREYRGTIWGEASCGRERLRSKEHLTLRPTETTVVGRVLTVTAFTGLSEVDFRCGGQKVHAVAQISGRARTSVTSL